MSGEADITDKLSRRDFFRTFPQQLMKGFREIKQLESLAMPKPDMKAWLDVNRCLAWGGLMCQSCYLACHLRDEAIVMNDQKPMIRANACDGCGVCVDACRTVNDPPSLAMK